MKECNVQAVCSITWSLVNQSDTLFVAHSQSFCYAVFYLEGYMVNAFAAIVQELLYCALRTCGLQQFQLNFANLQEGCLNLLVFYNFCFVNLQT